MEITLFIIGIFGFIIAYLTYKKSFINEPKENASFIIQQHEFAERSTKELIVEIEEYAILNNVLDKHFMQGLTFRESITFLQNASNKIFTTEIAQDLRQSQSGKLATENLAKSIGAHIKHVQEIRTHFKFFIKRDFTV